MILKRDKELAIYDGVVALLAEGKSVGELTVADIAKKAGIGKGTVYEYFRTKDEIVAKALVYTIKKSLHRARLAVQQVIGFDRRMEAFLQVVDEAAESSLPLFDTLMGCHGITGGLDQYLDRDQFLQSVCMEAGILIEEIRRAALRERILRRGVPERSVHFVISGCFASYLVSCHLSGPGFGFSRDEVRRQVVHSLKVSLAAM